MPELPEVESLRRFLEERVVGLQFARLDLAEFSALKTYDPPLDVLVGQTIVATHRRGKYLAFESAAFDTGAYETGRSLFLAIHLSLGGWMRWMEESPKTKPKPGAKGPLALRITFSDGSGVNVTEAGHEKRLSIHVVRDLDNIENVQTLGPDPLQADPVDVAARLRQETGWIKKALTSQKVIAGVGNAYSDEALHVAKLSPYKKANKLKDDEAARLVAAVTDVLSDAVERSKDVAVKDLKSEKKSGMRVHGRTGQKCPECGDIVREVSFATKSLQYCATCQTGGKPLADRRMSRLLK